MQLLITITFLITLADHYIPYMAFATLQLNLVQQLQYNKTDDLKKQ